MKRNDNWDNDDDLDILDDASDEREDNGIANLRKAKRADEKRIKELMERLEKFERQERESIVSKVLESKGVNSKAARLILKDLDDINEESVSHWLIENGEIIGYQPEEKQEAKVSEDVRAFARQDKATQFAASPDASDDLVDVLQNYNGNSEEELLSIIQNLARQGD